MNLYALVYKLEIMKSFNLVYHLTFKIQLKYLRGTGWTGVLRQKNEKFPKVLAHFFSFWVQMRRDFPFDRRSQAKKLKVSQSFSTFLFILGPSEK